MTKSPKIIPQGPRLLVENIYATVSDGGIHIPERSQDRRQVARARVLAVGAGAVNFNVGDVVYFMSGSGVAIESEGCVYLVVKAEEILAKDEPSAFQFYNGEFGIQCVEDRCETTARAKDAERVGWTHVVVDGVGQFRCPTHSRARAIEAAIVTFDAVEDGGAS